MNISTSIILDTRRIKNKNDKYPIKLRITINRVTRNYQTVFDLFVEEFERLSASRVSETLQAVRTSLQKLKRTLENFISDKKPSGFTEFENDFISDNKNFKRKKFKKFYLFH